MILIAACMYHHHACTSMCAFHWMKHGLDMKNTCQYRRMAMHDRLMTNGDAFRIARGCLPVDDIGDTFRIAQGWLPVDDNILHAIYCPLTTMGMRLESLGVACRLTTIGMRLETLEVGCRCMKVYACMQHDAIIFDLYMCMHVSHAKQRSACFRWNIHADARA